MKAIIVAVIWMIYAWGIGYFFHLFPWSDQYFQWWYVPQIFTCIALAVPFCLATDKVLEE